MGLFDNLSKLTGGTGSDQMGQAVEEMTSQAIRQRRSHERRWYDNIFFDDGYHFRVISRKTGRVIDTASRQSGYVERAIPRASRQIRGVTNLIFAAEPYPVVYPKRISESEFSKIIDPKTQQPIPGPDYDKAVKQAKDVAQKQGIWLSNEWEDQQELPVKLIDGLLKAMRNSVSWMQVYSDTRTQKIITEIYDAFDIICLGNYDDEQKLPFMTKACPWDIDKVKTSPIFEEAKVKNLTPDNKYATSEVKDAYMRSRYGTKNDGDKPTIVVKESYIKEYLSADNWENAVALSGNSGAMEGKSKGDQIMRQVWSAGGVTLRDGYVDYDEYPLVAIRLEPGPLYSVPFIERFIPQNKSLDIIVTRLEKWVNTMVVGTYMARKGENFELSNFPGGNKVEYETTAPAQMNIASPGNAPFNVIGLMDKYIEEQGATTSTLGQLPSGVKANSAIENIKQSEYANLKIPTLMLKQAIKRISERMLERADKDFLKPVEVSHVEDGQPKYFDIIGQRGMDLSQKVGKELPEGVVPISSKTKVRIEIEPGLGLTMEGKKEGMKSIITDLMALLDKGFVAPEALQQVLKKYLEVFGYGSTEEFMESMENGVTAGQMSENQIKQMQIAIVQALKDVGAVGPQADQKLVTASKVGTLQSLKDAGLVKNMGGDPNAEANQKVLDDMVKIYKDSPPDVRRQVETALGMQPSNEEEISPVQADTASKIHGMATANADTTLKAKAQDSAEGQAHTNAMLKAKEIQQKSVIKPASSAN